VRLYRIPSLVVVSAVALGAFAGTADADPVQGTKFEAFSVSQGTVDYNHRMVSIQGRLVQSDLHGVAAEAVSVSFQNSGWKGTIGSTVTDADGRFSMEVALPGSGILQAHFQGDGSLHGTDSDYVTKRAVQKPSRLLLDPLPRSVPAGNTITLSGTAQIDLDEGWQPLAGARIVLIGEQASSSDPDLTHIVTTGDGGRFRLSIPLTGTASWHAETYDSEAYHFWSREYFTPSWVNAVSKTRISSITMPRSAEAHRASRYGFHVKGAVERWNGSAWVPVKYVSVQLYYRMRGRKSWIR